MKTLIIGLAVTGALFLTISVVMAAAINYSRNPWVRKKGRRKK